MNTYIVHFKHSKNGRNWTATSKRVKAESDMSAMAQIKSLYDNVQVTAIKRVN